MYYISIIFILFISTITKAQDCIVPHLTNFTNTDWNAEWIKNNQIAKIIEREYLKPNQLHLVNYIYFDTLGYIYKTINGLSYPNSTFPSEDDHFSTTHYRYENTDGFILQFDSVIRRHNEKGLMLKPDTLRTSFNYVFNQLKNKEINIGNYKISYAFDQSGNLIKREEVPQGEEIVLNYKKGVLKNINTVRHFPVFVPVRAKTQISFTFKDGRIFETKDSDSGFSNQFYYNEKGEMIKQIELYKNRPQIIRTFEFVRK